VGPALSRLARHTRAAVAEGVPLSRLSSLRIGGPADLLVEPEGPADLAVALAILADAGVPVLVIGNGTNLLFDDRGVRGAVVRLGASFRSVAIAGDRIRAGAGVWVPALARAACKAHLGGLEHIAGIPGTLGGLLVMNGGSLRRSIGDSVALVHGLTARGEPVTLTRADCAFAYRRSRLAGAFTVTMVELATLADDGPAIRRRMIEILRRRRLKFPRRHPNCGSVFESSPDAALTPGRAIEEAGLKGATVGGCQISHAHANFIVNLGGGASGDVLRLVGLARRAVFDRTGGWLACELRYVAPDASVRPAHEVAAALTGTG
jgi:UDP-N-acetylmuramate dehydrogenase